MKNLLKYTGNKKKYFQIINNEIEKTNCDRYIEPFCGSASIFFNLNKNFNRGYIISDTYLQLIQIFKTFTKIEYDELFEFYNTNLNKFGNWGSNKEAFYSFRNDMNKKYFNSNTLEEGMFLYIINKSCINSIFRTGKNGINSAFGNRGRSLISEIDFSFFKEKLKTAKILNKDFFDYKDNDFDEKTFLFLDPPYSNTNHNYNSGDTFDFEKQKFLNKIKTIKSKIVYTDTYCEDAVKQLDNWRVEKLGEFLSIRPGKRKKVQNRVEVMYCNF